MAAIDLFPNVVVLLMLFYYPRTYGVHKLDSLLNHAGCKSAPCVSSSSLIWTSARYL
jgi:hypothetical protein